MKLYLLRSMEGSDYWRPWYDKAYGFVVAARDEEQARKIASEQSGDEGAGAWLDKKASTCKELKPRKAEVIIRDFAAA
jgi:hypothetical protein